MNKHSIDNQAVTHYFNFIFKGYQYIDNSISPDIQGNAWDPNIINKIKHKLKTKKPQAIVFERVDLMPLNFNKYIIECLKSNNNFYELKYDTEFLRNSYRWSSRVEKKRAYENNEKFYPESVKVELNDIQFYTNTKKFVTVQIPRNFKN